MEAGGRSDGVELHKCVRPKVRASGLPLTCFLIVLSASVYTRAQVAAQQHGMHREQLHKLESWEDVQAGGAMAVSMISAAKLARSVGSQLSLYLVSADEFVAVALVYRAGC